MSHVHLSSGNPQAPTGWTGPPTANSPRPPGVAVVAAVLAFVEAACFLLSILAALVGLALTGLPVAAGTADDDVAVIRAAVVGGLIVALVVTALLTLGGLFLLRGMGRRLLLLVTWTEVVLGVTGFVLLGVGLATFAPFTGDRAALHDLSTWSLVIGGGSLLLPIVRVGLAHRHAVRSWVAGPRRPGGRRVVGAVLVPLGALAAAGTVLILTVETAAAPVSVLAGPGSTGRAQDYQGESDWGRAYYQGGRPVAPPAAGDPLYAATYDAAALECAGGAMQACDDLFDVSPVGGVYEWYSSTCAGRLDHESDGGCVAELGAVVD